MEFCYKLWKFCHVLVTNSWLISCAPPTQISHQLIKTHIGHTQRNIYIRDVIFTPQSLLYELLGINGFVCELLGNLRLAALLPVPC